MSEVNKKKIDFADSIYEMARCCLINKVPMFRGNIYEGLIEKYEREVRPSTQKVNDNE